MPSAAGTNGAVNGAATVTNNIAKFHCKSNGVLYENEILQVLYKVYQAPHTVLAQIGVKTECRANLARLAIFYGNKTNLPFLNFQPNVTTSPTLGMNLLLQVCFLILIFVTHSIYPNFPQVKQVDSTVEAGAQFQQV